MKIDDRSSGDVKIVSPAGRLDAPSSEELKAKMEGLIGDGCRKMVANLDRGELFGSSLSLAAVLAVILNLIFRIDTAKRHRLVLKPGADDADSIFNFMERQGPGPAPLRPLAPVAHRTLCVAPVKATTARSSACFCT